jgi:hypothetical protein
MKKKWYLIILAVILLLIQLIRIDKTNPNVDPAKDFIAINNPSPEIAKMIKTSCYDCHSNESKYPWYSNIAPISWYLKNHINEARGRVNFSEWGDYPANKISRKLEACSEDVTEGEMPLGSYTLMHSNANLNSEQVKILSEWFKEESEKIQD